MQTESDLNLYPNNLTELRELIEKYGQCENPIVLNFSDWCFKEQLIDLPEEMKNLSCVSGLSIWGKSCAPETLAQLCTWFPRLIELRIGNSNLTELHAQIGQLTNLEKLNLDHNRLTPATLAILGNLKQLKELHLSGNNLTDLPIEIGQLTNLKELYLDYNSLTPQALAKLGNLKQLGKLSLIGNNLTDLPIEIGQLTNLEEINLENNKLTSSAIAKLGTLSKLEEIYLTDNKTLTKWPEEMRGLTSLRFIQTIYCDWIINHQARTMFPELRIQCRPYDGDETCLWKSF